MPSERSVRVCVIGGGVSGLRAAQTILSQSGLSGEDALIVEAQNRIGGRIKTDEILSKLGLKYDLGAAWFHDGLTNSVLYDSIQDGSFDPLKDGYFDEKKMAIYARDHEGELDEVSENLDVIVSDIETFIELYFFASPELSDVLLEEIVKMYYEKYGFLLTDSQKQYCSRMVRYTEIWLGIPLSHSSTLY